MVFDIRQTYIAKGVAILLLIWRHFFTIGVNVDSLFYVFGMPVENFLDIYSVVCVSIFLVLSGYGMQISLDNYYKKNKENKSLPVICYQFTKNHIIKLWSEYILLFIIIVAIFSIYDVDMVINNYDRSIWKFLINALGLSNCFGTPSMFNAWWFTSLILVLYALFPFLWLLNRYCPEILLAFSVTMLLLPGNWDFNSMRMFGLPFVLGMYLSKKNLINRAATVFDTTLKKILVSFLMLVSSCIIRSIYALDTEKFDAPFALSVIMISFFFLSKIPILNKAFYELGRKSSIMYLSHSLFIFFPISVFHLPISVLTYLLSAVMSFSFAWLIILIKKNIGYDRLVGKLCKP